MWLKTTLCILYTAAAVLSGCGQTAPDDSWPDPRPLGAPMASYRPRQGPGASGQADDRARPGAAEPAGALSLPQALAAALMRSAKLAGFAWSVRIAEAEQLQASVGPNPELEAEVEEFGGTGEASSTRSAETTISLSQLIELGGKRRKRVALAEAERKLAGWDYEEARIKVLTEVAQRFIDVLALQDKVALAADNLALAEQLRAAAAERVEAGKAPPLESTKAGVVAAMSDIQLKRIRRQLLAARRALAATWGSTKPLFQSAAGKLDAVQPVVPLERLEPLVAQSPAVARWAAEMTHRRAAVDLARARAVPDLKVRLGYKYLGESSDQGMVVSVGIPLPIFDRNQGTIDKARFGVIKARFDRSAALVQAQAALAKAYQDLAVAHDEATVLARTVLPGARAAFDASSKLFEQGKTSYLDVLDSQRTLTNVRGQYLDTLAAYHRAVAEIEGLIAQHLPSASSGARPEGPGGDDHDADDRKADPHAGHIESDKTGN